MEAKSLGPQIPSELTSDLHTAFQDVVESRSQAQQWLLADQDHYHVYIPKYGHTAQDKLSVEARLAAISSIGLLHRAKESIDAGLVCASEETISAVTVLNESKLKFKESVAAIKKFAATAKTPTSQIRGLLNKESSQSGFRTPALEKAMKTVGINELDLKRCYLQTRIMPENLKTFSWTWATTHTRIKKHSLEKALGMVEEYFEGNTDALDINKKKLAACHPNEMLAEKVMLKNNQLRANYAFEVDGELVRKPCTISGVVIVPGEDLPSICSR
ncbi:hypothetical protein A3741_28705 [Oleiphilus sp. HI0069]|nr:hypothetical protein A3741_28705 [Oleiphilus sp. HI0069]